MAYDQSSLDDYVDVATRIAEFRIKYPHGWLAPADPQHPYRIERILGTDKDGREIEQTFIVYVAAAHRESGDDEPGVGCAWEIFPGRTPYTRGSELMNAETSAWGRAIIALGASDSKAGIASREEVRNRQAERDQPASVGLSAEQREDRGMMTTEQRREHTALKPKTDRPADRTNDPADDVWAGQPAGEWQPVQVEDKPGSSNGRQRQRLGILYGQRGITDRAERLADVNARLPEGRQVGSSTELSYVEAEQVISELEKLVKEAK